MKILTIPALGIIFLSACGGSEEGSSPGAITLSGPVSMALAASDQSTTASGGTISIPTMLATFPAAALADFASRFPATVAEEQYRTVRYQDGTMTDQLFGISGESADGITEIEAEYNADGIFLRSRTGTEDAVIPDVVSNVVISLYPEFTIDEAESWLDGDNIETYEIELENSQSELEVIVDATGNLLETSEEIPQSMIPASIIAAAALELSDIDFVEFERVTNTPLGTVTYLAEVETEIEGMEIEYSEAGGIISISWEQDL